MDKMYRMRLTTSGVISVGGLNAGFSSITFSSGILPLPKTIPFFSSASAGTASAYQFTITYVKTQLVSKCVCVCM